MKTALMLLAMIVTAGVTEGGQPAIDAKAPDFSLFDQRDNPVTLRQLVGKPVILIASDDEGAKQNPAWRKTIVEKYRERILVIGVADVRKVPFFLKSKFKRDFQKDPATILLDWDGVIFTSYGLEKGVSNIIVIDKKGFQRYFHSGSAEQTAVERLFRVLDTTLE